MSKEIEYYHELQAISQAESARDANAIRRAKASYLFKSQGVVVALCNFALILGCIASGLWAGYARITHKDLALPFTLFLMSLPSIGVGYLDELGRAEKVNPFAYWFCRGCLWYVKAIGWVGVLVVGWNLIESGIGALDLKAIGLIIIVMLGLILYQMNRRKE
ncbi:MAG TPA: hypothetical protein VK465_06935 [Fibrobacteria bacterium]|nr:hypothetical protein [Fibrobacteria bacterium]